MQTSARPSTPENIIGRAHRVFLLDPRVRMLASVLLVFIAYLLATKTRALFMGAGTSAGVIWPPNSVTLAALLLSPKRRWWAYGVVAGLADLIFDYSQAAPYLQATPLLAMVGMISIAAGNLVEVFFAGAIVRGLIPDSIDIAQPRQFMTVVASAVLVGAPLGACIGAAVLASAPPVSYWVAWRQWWLADSVAHVTVTPFLVVFFTDGMKWLRSLTGRHILGILGGAASTLSAVAYLAFSHHTAAKPLTLAEVFLVVTVATTASAWVGALETAATVLLIAVACGLLTTSAIGPFAGLPQAESIINMQAFLLLFGTSSLFIAGLVTQRNLLRARLQDLTIKDELTGSFNRRYLLMQAAVEVERAKRFGRPLAFLFLDLDHFKQVNDRFGHQTGDLVLSTFSDMCRTALRPSDILVRYGGEEFVVVLPETGLDAAISAAERIRKQWRETVISIDPLVKGLTVSIGVSALCSDGDSLDTILERIDNAMYRAKQLGRDRIEVTAAQDARGGNRPVAAPLPAGP